MVEPNGPTYQIKLMGVAAIRSKEVAPTIHDTGYNELYYSGTSEKRTLW